MKVAFETVLKDFLSGKDLFIPVSEEERGSDGAVIKPAVNRPFTLKDAVVNALMIVEPKKMLTIPGVEKARRFDLGLRIYNGATEISTEEVAMIKQLVGEGYNPMIVGQVWSLLEKGVE